MTATCSDADRAAGDSPVGSASAFDRFLLIDYREPWGRTAADDAVRDVLAPAARQEVVEDSRLRAFAIRPVGARRQRPLRPIMRGTIGRGGVITSADGDQPGPAALIGVCTNAKRDRCCAVRGRPVAAALAEEFGEAISEISHLGGHRFAATMLVLPLGYYYGQLDADSARRVTRHALDGLVDPQNLRGRADLSPAAQAADAHWRQALGPTPIDAVEITGEVSDGPATTVTAIVDGVGERVVAQYEPGDVIAETICGGKPFQTGRWIVR